MSGFNGAYIILGLALFVLGMMIVFQSLLGLFPIGAGAFFILLGISATARNIP